MFRAPHNAESTIARVSTSALLGIHQKSPAEKLHFAKTVSSEGETSFFLWSSTIKTTILSNQGLELSNLAGNSPGYS
jgi:hypothetical protein